MSFDQLQTYPKIPGPVAVSTAWDALFWRGDGSLLDELLYGRSLMSASANDEVVSFEDVRLIPERVLDHDGRAARAFAVLRDAPRPLLMDWSMRAPFPGTGYTSRAVALMPALSLVAFLDIGTANVKDAHLVAVPVSRNRLIAWDRKSTVPFDRLTRHNAAQFGKARTALIAHEQMRRSGRTMSST